MLHSMTEEAVRDLDEALKVAPAGRDIRRILLKAKEDTEGNQRQSSRLMETSTDTILDCSSSGIGSSLASSERG